MTREEAVKLVKEVTGMSLDWDDAHYEALQMAIKALEKDIPKAPKKSDIPRYGMGYEYYDWCCPTCNKFLAYEGDIKRQQIHHCKCGQRLDWGKVK